MGMIVKEAGIFFLMNVPALTPVAPVFLGLGLRLIACWECGFEFRRGHVCLL